MSTELFIGAASKYICEFFYIADFTPPIQASERSLVGSEGLIHWSIQILYEVDA